MQKPRKPTRRDLLVVIGRLQSLVSSAHAYHGNDRDPWGYEKGQKELTKAFALCIAALGLDPPIEGRLGPWGKYEPPQ